MSVTVNWPTSINYLVERNAYTIDPHDDNARTDFEQGPARVRKRFTTSRALFTLVWKMSAFELLYFEAFYKYDLANGTRWFNIPIYSPDAYAIREARFNGKYTPSNDGSAFDWNVSAVLELRELPTLTQDEYLYLNAFGGNLSIEDRLDPLVNIAYPHATESLPL
jgi:hypothetical protein